MSPLSDFPSLHPMVVHFPIVMLALAPLFQTVGLLTQRNDWFIASSVLLFGGIGAALVASHVFHAEPLGASDAVRLVFERHEAFANYTLWAATSAAICKLPRLIGYERRWLEIVALVVIVGCLVLVSITGHLGAELTHIHHVRAE